MLQEMERALGEIAKTKGDEFAYQLRPILLTNLDRGRTQLIVDMDPAHIHAYALLVAQNFAKLKPYLHQLQIEQSPEAWEPLYANMQKWAYNFLIRKGFTKGENTAEIASECASNAATSLIKAYFPYDTEFDSWAHVIVQHACRKYISKAFKKSTIPDDKKVELNDELTDPKETPLEISALLKEDAKRLIEALSQLSEARRTVIQLIFFESLKPDEVAKHMGKTTNAIYGLQFKALEDLRKILSQNRDNLND